MNPNAYSPTPIETGGIVNIPEFADAIVLVFAFLIGFMGSAAYITALLFNFIGDGATSRAAMLKPFCTKYSQDIHWLKFIWYCVVGGTVAVVFQLNIPNLVAVQNFILGATWPAIVSQFLSGRMSSPAKEDLEDITKELRDTGSTSDEYKEVAEGISELRTQIEKIKPQQ